MRHLAWLPFLASVALLPGCSPAKRQGSAAAGPSAGPPRQVRFADVTREAGVRFQHVNGAASRYYFPETFGSGALFFDYDRDGWLDLFLVNSGPLPGSPTGTQPTHALYRNNRDGTFRDVTVPARLDVPMYGMGATAGDYDNDGDPDLYVTAVLGPSRLFRNQGDGTFVDAAKEAGVENAGHWGTSCAWLDYDLDGRLDLFVCNYVRYRPDREMVCRQGRLRVYCGPLIYPADSCRLYRNLGNGRFRETTHPAGIFKQTGKSLGVAIWDFNGDRYPEIVVANDLSPNYLFRNNRDGTFTEIGVEAGVAYGGDGMARSGMGIDVADAMNDGKASIFISNFAREPNSFFVEHGPFQFSDRSYETGMGQASLQDLGFGLFFFDYDNDGWKDAFVANGHIQPDIARYEPPLTHAQRPRLYHNQRDGTFAEVGSQLGGPLAQANVGRGAAFGDYDNDGDLDVLVTDNNGPARLLRNEEGNRANWLAVRLRGSRSNRDGLGAEVRVHAGGRILRDQARSGGSYLSGSDPRLYFGLGPHAQADLVEVRWPDGSVDRRRAVPTRQVLEVAQGPAP